MKLLILIVLASCAQFTPEKKVKTTASIENWDRCTTKWHLNGQREMHCYKFQVIGVTLGTTQAWSDDDGQIYVDEKEFILGEE